MAYHNRNSFIQHCAVHDLLAGNDQGRAWPIRWTGTGFVVGGFLKIVNETQGEKNFLDVGFFRSFETDNGLVFRIGMAILTI